MDGLTVGELYLYSPTQYVDMVVRVLKVYPNGLTTVKLCVIDNKAERFGLIHMKPYTGEIIKLYMLNKHEIITKLFSYKVYEEKY